MLTYCASFSTTATLDSRQSLDKINQGEQLDRCISIHHSSCELRTSCKDQFWSTGKSGFRITNATSDIPGMRFSGPVSTSKCCPAAPLYSAFQSDSLPLSPTITIRSIVLDTESFPAFTATTAADDSAGVLVRTLPLNENLRCM